ncbi:MAG: hypothetical protein N0E48_05300 [Candidatus Thiodiazotropha endolucinida]|nr:hypothetical protein [Candidatus Thiodiazotropha taylori]MCW4342766.1 hypothetical protein [Candidatus Thiodiazotropha endolucinida]
MLVHKHLREAKKKSARRFDDNARDGHFEVGDPVYVKNHKRKSKLDSYASGFYRIVEQKSPFTFKVRNQLDGKILDTHARYLRHAKVDSWKITKQERNRKLRRARYVVTPPSSDTESPVEQKPLDKLVQMKKQHRSGSSDEEDIPKLELTKRIMSRQRRLRKQSAGSGSYSSDDGNSSSSGSDDSDRKGRHYSNDSSYDERSDREQPVPMDTNGKQEQNHYSSDTEEYFSTGEFERNQGEETSRAEYMDVDNVTRRKHTRSRTRQKVKRLLYAMSNLLD